MSRPTHNISLPLLAGGEISCTVKTPKISLVAKVRKADAKRTFASEQRMKLFLGSNDVNGVFAIAEAQLIAARKDALGKGDELLESRVVQCQRAFDDAAQALAVLESQMEAKDVAQIDAIIGVAQLILNLPNDKSETPERPRSMEEIDWDSCDPEALMEAVNFFLTGKTV